MQFEPTSNPSQAKDDSLQPVRKGLGGLWTGGDQNVESTFVNGDDGKLEQLWISARSEGGKERFVYCNQAAAGRGGYNFLPGDVAREVAFIYEPIVRKDRSLSDSMADILRVMEPALWTGFWTEGVGEDMFTLPAGLKSKQEVSLMPSFEAFCENPTLGRNLFAVAGEKTTVGIFLNERENYSIIAFNDSVFRIPGAEVAPASLRDFTFAHANMLVDGSFNEFYSAVEPFRVIKTWRQAGGPEVMLAERSGDQATLEPFRL